MVSFQREQEERTKSPTWGLKFSLSMSIRGLNSSSSFGCFSLHPQPGYTIQSPNDILTAKHSFLCRVCKKKQLSPENSLLFAKDEYVVLPPVGFEVGFLPGVEKAKWTHETSFEHQIRFRQLGSPCLPWQAGEPPLKVAGRR